MIYLNFIEGRRIKRSFLSVAVRAVTSTQLPPSSSRKRAQICGGEVLCPNRRLDLSLQRGSQGCWNTCLDTESLLSPSPVPVPNTSYRAQRPEQFFFTFITQILTVGYIMKFTVIIPNALQIHSQNQDLHTRPYMMTRENTGT